MKMSQWDCTSPYALATLNREFANAISARDYDACVAFVDAMTNSNIATGANLGTAIIMAIVPSVRPLNTDIVELLITRGAAIFAGEVSVFTCMLHTRDVRIVKLVERLQPAETAEYLAKANAPPRYLLHGLYEGAHSVIGTMRGNVEVILWLHSKGFRSHKFLDGRYHVTEMMEELVLREKLGGAMVVLVGAIQRGGETAMTTDVLRRVFDMLSHIKGIE